MAAFTHTTHPTFISTQTGSQSRHKIITYLKDMNTLFRGWGPGEQPEQVLGVPEHHSHKGEEKTTTHLDTDNHTLTQVPRRSPTTVYSLTITPGTRKASG